ncbi:hypothetical protein BT63DRAFT_421789 [Microthyrium microscopicum]|uniref:Alpha/beta-hydrolase n=1 Tax=Microthyrium microscopicum TaxID=703497 RepID=A0A6A6UPK8_9PEZI|nr:hypothetical protein BT63DRAFT_421789 [Microthyrium microscopicum]
MASTPHEPTHLTGNQPHDNRPLPIQSSYSSGSEEDNDLLLDTGHISSTGSLADPGASFIGVSISPVQTRLASAKTPAVEKADAIRNGDGYFSLDTQLETSNSDLSTPSGGESTFDIAASAGNAQSRQHERHYFSLSNYPTQLDGPTSDTQSPGGSAQASGMRAGSDDVLMDMRRLQRPSIGLRRVSSDSSLNQWRAMSIASSLGDDTRFLNVREQVNSRFKAIKDSFQDSNLRLLSIPSLPPFPNMSNINIPNILAVFSEPLAKEEDVKTSSPKRRNTAFDIRESVMELIRKRTGSIPKPLSTIYDPSTDRVAGMKPAAAASHPYFVQAISQLTGDIVILGGYRGSVLRSTDHTRLWIPIKAGLNLAKVNLQVGLEDEDEERMAESIVPDGMLTHIGPIDISRRLIKRLRACPNAKSGKLRVHNYGYDWRLSPSRLADDLRQFLETLPCNAPDIPPSQRGATVIAHSLGGIITRHTVNQRPDLFAGVLYAGTPQNCSNILGPLRNGDDVLFNSKILTAEANFSMRTSFIFLPLNGKLFIDETTKKELHVDFFDVNNWIKYNLSPCVTKPARSKRQSLLGSIKPNLPSLNDAMNNIPILGRRLSSRKPKTTASSDSGESFEQVQHTHLHRTHTVSLVPQMTATGNRSRGPSTNHSSIPYEAAVAYLTRTLKRSKKFKEFSLHNNAHAEANAYPPFAVIYGKSEPTVSAARVDGYDSIKRADVYDNLSFASGDGVVLARESMLPTGYRAARGGVVGSDRGHISLLGDLEAVGRCLVAMRKARIAGVGMGTSATQGVHRAQ